MRPSGGSRSAYLISAIIAAVVLVAYWPSFSGALVFDDLTSIVRNPNIRSVWTAFSAPPELTVSGRPVASLTLALNYALAGGTAPVWGYHAVNLLVHVLNALLLFGIVGRTLRSPRLVDRFGSDATFVAAAVAVIWALHPLNTSAVTYVVQRVESLMALFFLATLYCAIRALEKTSGVVSQVHVKRPPRSLWPVLAIAACALGMATKEVMVGAPIIVWLWDWTFTKAAGKTSGTSTAYGQRPTAFYLSLCATWLILAWLVWHERRGHSVGAGVDGWTAWTYLLTQTHVIAHYVKLALWPAPLVFDYAWPPAHTLRDVAPYAAALALAAGLTIAGVARRLPAAFLGVWFLVILAPTSSVLPIVTEVVDEHRMYLPLMAIVAGVVIAVARVWPTRTPARALALAAIGVVAMTLGTLTFARNLDYGSEERLWADTVRKQPDNPRARHNYGTVLLGENQFDSAIAQLTAAIALNPRNAEAHLTLGLALCSEHRIKEAEPHLAQSIILGNYTPAYQLKAAAALGTACGDRAK